MAPAPPQQSSLREAWDKKGKGKKPARDEDEDDDMDTDEPAKSEPTATRCASGQLADLYWNAETIDLKKKNDKDSASKMGESCARMSIFPMARLA